MSSFIKPFVTDGEKGATSAVKGNRVGTESIPKEGASKTISIDISAGEAPYPALSAPAARDSLTNLGPNVSVNLAFVRMNPEHSTRAQIYTMQEGKSKCRIRNCQGGYMEEEKGDKDVFDAAAREAFEEIEPGRSSEIEAAAAAYKIKWTSSIAALLRELYTCSSPRMSFKIVNKNMKWKGREFVGVHVSFRVVGDASTWESLGLVNKPCGSMDPAERTFNLRWDDLHYINAPAVEGDIYMPFDNTDADFDHANGVFSSKLYNDERGRHSVIECQSQGCHNSFLQDDETRHLNRYCRGCCANKKKKNNANSTASCRNSSNTGWRGSNTRAVGSELLEQDRLQRGSHSSSRTTSYGYRGPQTTTITTTNAAATGAPSTRGSSSSDSDWQAKRDRKCNW